MRYILFFQSHNIAEKHAARAVLRELPDAEIRDASSLQDFGDVPGCVPASAEEMEGMPIRAYPTLFAVSDGGRYVLGALELDAECAPHVPLSSVPGLVSRQVPEFAERMSRYSRMPEEEIGRLASPESRYPMDRQAPTQDVSEIRESAVRKLLGLGFTEAEISAILRFL